MSHQILREIARLQLARPAVNAAPAVVAAWYELKAELLEHLVADGDLPASEALRLARIAHDHATDLLRGAAA